MCVHGSPPWKPIRMEQHLMLADAVKALVTTNQDLELTARGLVVDAQEVFEALTDAKPDTAETVALMLLAKYNPYTPKPKEKK